MPQIDLSKLSGLFEYSQSNPLIFSSGLFLFLFLGFALFYSFMSRRVMLRIVYVTLFSLYFYYKSSGFYFLLLVFMSLSDYAIGHFLHGSRTERQRKGWVALSLAIDLGILVYFKYTNMFIDLINNFTESTIGLEDIFLPIGISFFTFQSLSYVIDVYRRRIPPIDHWIDYIFYISFFPQLVAGPIVRARDFIPQIRQNPLVVTREMFDKGIYLVICGLFKKAVISDYISVNFVDRVFDNPVLYSGLENLMGVYGYALQIYCDFSGYSDMAIGIALMLGFRFNINFDSPYQSATITEFWRRWHISLSSWLKDYLYISLGGNRKGRWRTYLNLMITMLLGGLWHGASWRFVLWGGIHGVALAVHKLTMSLFPGFKAQGQDMPSPWRRVLGVLVTFHVVCFSWIFFRADSMEVAWAVLRQIFSRFNGHIFFEFLSGYRAIVFLMAVGYLLHFMPKRMEDRFQEAVSRLPMFMKALLVSLLIWLVMQIKSGDIQPFIYFQF